MLDQDQTKILDDVPRDVLRSLIRDLESTDYGMTPATFAIAVSQEFSRPNATKEAIIAYCKSKLEQPQDRYQVTVRYQATWWTRVSADTAEQAEAIARRYFRRDVQEIAGDDFVTEFTTEKIPQPQEGP